MALPRRLAIFASVGAAATLGYVIIAESLALAGLRPSLASLTAYGLCGLWSYFGHKRLTFASAAPHATAAPRFILVMAAGLLVAAGAPLLYARLFGPSPYVAVLATCVFAPLVGFIGAQNFAFRAVD